MVTIGFPGISFGRDLVRQFNKRILNPVMLRLAGRKYWYAAVIHHTGRRSGKQYATPVVADVVDDGFLVPLPYGTGVDWLRNILASGKATLDIHGETVSLADPEVLPAEQALPLLPASRARHWRLLRMGRFLRMSTVSPPEQVSRPDLRAGDPRIHDLVAEIDEAIDAGDEPLVEELSKRLRQLDPTAGAGADT